MATIWHVYITVLYTVVSINLHCPSELNWSENVANVADIDKELATTCER